MRRVIVWVVGALLPVVGCGGGGAGVAEGRDAGGGAGAGGAGGAMGGFPGTGGTAGTMGGSSGTGGSAGAAGASGGTGGSGGAGGSAFCNSSVGVVQPLSACSQQDPCTHTPATRSATVATPSDMPSCRTSATSSHPKFDDGTPIHYVDPDGIDRYACAYMPPDASPSKPRPLVVFFHGSFGGADDVYNLTSLRDKATSYDLSGDPARPGYVLVSVNARNLHWPSKSEQDGAKHDIFHRDLGSPSSNPDLANFDALVDLAVSGGKVDPKRIYTMGWSNGGRFAQMVAIARHQTPTPGGNRVAAAAVYSGTDPFNNTTDSQVPSCQLAPYPKSTVPIGLIGRACDLLPCDEAQAQDLRSEGLAIEPGSVMSTWVGDLQSKVGASVQRLIVAGTGHTVAKCSSAALCSKTVAMLNHIHWPDGVADKSGIDHEPEMLGFLRQHPLQ